MEKHIIAALDGLMQEYGIDDALGIQTSARLAKFAEDADWLWTIVEINSPRGIRATWPLFEKCGEVWHAYSEYHRAIYAESPTDYSLGWAPSTGETCQ